MTANAVIEAIRSGAVTSLAIGAHLGIKRTRDVASKLTRLQKSGRIIKTEEVVPRREGRPLIIWRVNEDWAPPVASDETRAKLRVAMMAQQSDPDWESRRIAAIRATSDARKASVPEWVLPHHIGTYREINRVLGEHSAAQWARGAKRLDAKSGDNRANKDSANAAEMLGC